MKIMLTTANITYKFCIDKNVSPKIKGFRKEFRPIKPKYEGTISK